MEPLPNTIICAHKDAERTGRACEHLLKKATDEFYSSSEHFRYFTGRGADFVLLCPECAKKSDFGEPHWRTVCDSCVQDLACGKRLGEVGTVEFSCREAGLALNHRSVVSAKKIAAAGALGQRTDGRWLLLSAECELLLLDPTAKTLNGIGVPLPPNIDRGQPLMLCVSSDARFAAIANTYGRHGVVVDLERECVTMELIRGNYYNEHCKFPLAFTEHGGKQLIIHATDWNRLDVSNPVSGQLLTSREPTSYQRGQDRPSHYVDYFQCSLAVSPGGEWVAGNGWIWHPIGCVTSWSVKRWLEGNVWESEDGPSKKTLCGRDYYWNGPLCWIDDHTLAVWGLGDDDILLIPGVRIFDVRSGRETSSFIGPVGGSIAADMLVNGKEQHFRISAGSLVFDQWLYSWMEGKPFTVWDVKDGACVLEQPDFTPIDYHRGTKEFLSQLPDGTICLSCVRASTCAKPIRIKR